MKLRGYALGSLASIAVHVLALTLLALAWRADSLRPAGNTPIPVWLVADRQAAVGSTAPKPASAPPAPPPEPGPPTPSASPGPRREPAPLSAPTPDTRPNPAPAAPAPRADQAPPVSPESPAPVSDGAEMGRSESPVDAGPGDDAPSQPARIEREYRALSRPEPAYPQQALARGIEGDVILEFTVTATGTTRDLRVLDANPAGVFEAAALAAAHEFRYQPRIVAGTPVDVPGVRSRIRFQIRPR